MQNIPNGSTQYMETTDYLDVCYIDHKTKHVKHKYISPRSTPMLHPMDQILKIEYVET